jgi:hypothetical protein
MQNTIDGTDSEGGHLVRTETNEACPKGVGTLEDKEVKR